MSPYTHLHVCFTSTSLERARTYTHASVLRRPSGKTLDALSACAQVSFAPPVALDHSASIYTCGAGCDAKREKNTEAKSKRVCKLKEVNVGELFNILQGDKNCCQKRKREKKKIKIQFY